MTEPANILLIRLKSIGDVIFTLPAVNLVRDNFPQARITMLTSAENASIVGGFPAVDEIMVLDRAAFRRLDPQALWANTFGLWRQFANRKFGLAIDFQGYGETAIFTWLTRAPERWGSVYRRTRAWAYTRGMTRNDGIHPVAWNLSLLTQCGLKPLPPRNEFRLGEGAVESARQFLLRQGYDSAQPLLYLQPFTSSAAKNWPLENYLALARFWRQRGVQVIVGGGPADRPALESACAGICAVAAGVPRLTDYGLMRLATLIVGGDTGFLHLAVAMGKRVLMLMKPFGSGTTSPFGHPEWVVAPPGELPVAGIEVDKVIQATTEAFEPNSY